MNSSKGFAIVRIADDVPSCVRSESFAVIATCKHPEIRHPLAGCPLEGMRIAAVNDAGTTYDRAERAVNFAAKRSAAMAQRANLLHGVAGGGERAPADTSEGDHETQQSMRHGDHPFWSRQVRAQVTAQSELWCL